MCVLGVGVVAVSGIANILCVKSQGQEKLILVEGI